MPRGLLAYWHPCLLGPKGMVLRLHPTPAAARLLGMPLPLLSGTITTYVPCGPGVCDGTVARQVDKVP